MEGRARFRPVAIAALAVLLIAACGGDGGGGGATAVSSGASTAAATAAGATAPAGASSPTTAAAPATTAAPTAASTAAATTTGAAGGSASPQAVSPVASPAGGASPAAASQAERYVIVPDKSEASYRVRETFFGIGLNTAVGRTNAISGEMFIDRQRLSASRIGPITVNISTLKSDEIDRDENIQQNWLESAKYPQATFVTKRLEGLPDGPYTEGQELTFKIVGDLTVRTVTKEVTWDATGKIEGGVFTGTATTNFNMTDFGFEPPEIAGTLKAENGVIVELELQAKQAS